MGRTLAAEVRLPVGIVTASIGYPVESWLSRESLAATPEAGPVLAYDGSYLAQCLEDGYNSRNWWVSFNEVSDDRDA